MPIPRVWVLPYTELIRFIRSYKGQTNISRAAILRDGTSFENGWHHIEKLGASATD